MALTVQERIQINAIKNREFYKIYDFGGYILLANDSYGVYIPNEDLMLNIKQYPTDEEMKKLDMWEVEDKEEPVKVIREAVTFGKDIANAVINKKKEKAWVWQKYIKEFGKKAMYGMFQTDKGKMITVSDVESGELIGVIQTIEDIEIQKNEAYYI